MSTIQRANELYSRYGLSELLRRGVGEAARQLTAPYRYLDGPDRWLGAKYYGNHAGFHNNVGGDIAELKCRLRSRAATRSLAASEEARASAVELREHGYAMLGNVVDPETLETVIARYETILEEGTNTRVNSSSHDPGDDEVYLRGVAAPQEEHFPEALRLVTDEVVDVMRAYYRAHAQVLSFRAYRTHHIPPEIMDSTEIYNNFWHCDGKTTDHIKLFVCLSETTEEDGPLHVMPKPSTRTFSKQRPTFDRDRDGEPGGMVDQSGDAVTLTGPPGTAMLANTQSCLHRAGVPDPGHSRDLMQFYMAPSPTPMPDSWAEQGLDGAVQPVWSRLVRY